MPGVVPNAFAKFQKNSINNESGKNTWYEGGLCPILPISDIWRGYIYVRYRRIGHAGSFTCRTVAPKLETQNKKEDQISTPHPPDNAESEVFSEVRVPRVRFF